jgi:hypothetical protein
VYRNCVWCYADLGQNESIEHFPVGRRLAFDAAKGWLWVVCRKCDRWNLTPLEERWEAIEECERRFRDSKLRVSTDEIGLVRIDNGLDLIRIGAPLRPEFAVWRYGDRFARRRKQFYAIGGATAIGGAAMMIGPSLFGFLDGSHMDTMLMSMGATALTAFEFYRQLPRWTSSYYRKWATARVTLPGQARRVALRGDSLADVTLARTEGGWAMSVPYSTRKDGWPEFHRVWLEGEEARAVVARILPVHNARGATAGTVKTAVEVLSETPNVDALFAKFATERGKSYTEYMAERQTHLAGGHPIIHGQTTAQRLQLIQQLVTGPNGFMGNLENGVPIASIPDAPRLALEMASHESGERRAMEGELQLLTAAWKEASEIAQTSDSMFLPDAVVEGLARLKGLPRSN